MKDWLQKQIDNGWKDLQGLSLSAHVPLKDQVLNELLTEALRGASTQAAVNATSRPDLRPLMTFVRRAEVRTTEGALVVDVEIRI